MLKNSRFFVGIKEGERTVFKSKVAVEDLQETYNDIYDEVIGPFNTKRGANVMAWYGDNNPHCQTVRQAEELADNWSKYRTIDGFTEEGLRLFNVKRQVAFLVVMIFNEHEKGVKECYTRNEALLAYIEAQKSRMAKHVYLAKVIV